MHKNNKELYYRWLYSKWLEDIQSFIVALIRNSNNPRFAVLVEREETCIDDERGTGGKRYAGVITQIKSIQGSSDNNTHFLSLFPDSFLLAPDDQHFLYHCTSRNAAESAIRNMTGLVLGFNREGFFVGKENSRDAIHLINEDPTRLRESVKESRLGNLVQRLEQLDGTYYDELIPYLVHLDKYDTIICIDASKGIAQRDHIYAYQKTAAILTPFVPFEDLVYAATSDGFIWWTRAHGMKFDMKNIVPQTVPYRDYGSVVRN